LLGYFRSFTHRKDGPGAARPWWVQGEALAAGGDFAGFASDHSKKTFIRWSLALPPWEAGTSRAALPKVFLVLFLQKKNKRAASLSG
jgi:hypothetical protein